MTYDDYMEMDCILESVFDTAMEASEKTISTEKRNSLPDDCFGIIEEDENGNVRRLYPLRVPKDKKATEELLEKAIRYFNYAKPERQKQLAEKIMDTLKTEKIKKSIVKTSQIFKYVSVDSVPPNVTVTEPQKRASKKK